MTSDVTVSELALFLKQDCGLLRDALHYAAVASDSYFLASEPPDIAASCSRLFQLSDTLHDKLLDLGMRAYNLKHTFYREIKLTGAELQNLRLEVHAVIIDLDRLFPAAGISNDPVFIKLGLMNRYIF